MIAFALTRIKTPHVVWQDQAGFNIIADPGSLVMCASLTRRTTLLDELELRQPAKHRLFKPQMVGHIAEG
jgi:hypothetical protein